jgi:hypothetical protein
MFVFFGPKAFGTSWGKVFAIIPVVYPLDGTVNPAKAKRYRQGFVTCQFSWNILFVKLNPNSL